MIFKLLTATLILSFPVTGALAQTATLTDGNSAATVDLSSTGVGMNGWTVNGVNQLAEQSFWYAVGSSDPAQRINTLTLSSYGLSAPNSLAAVYSGSAFQIDANWSLFGAAPGYEESDISELIRITNTSSTVLNFHFWEYVNLNLLGMPQNTLASITGGNTATQDNGALGVSETVDVPTPSRYEADFQPTVLGDVEAGLLSDNASQSNGDLAWAFEWDQQISPGNSLIISKDKQLSVVPEPGTFVLLGIGAIGLLAFAWRRRGMRQFASAAAVLLALTASVGHAQTLTTLCSFNGSNGEGPRAGLTLIGNTLYGTTNGGGTVFSIPVSGGTPTVIASVDNTLAGLTLSADGSTLYGTTIDGGAYNYGTVFSVPVSGGSPTVLATFNASFAGDESPDPYGDLTLSGNTLYGTTCFGGAYADGGTVFSVPVSGGSPTVLGSFARYQNGCAPEAGLTLSGNTLYGTTSSGGPNGLNVGTVFSIPVGGGSPTVLATFNGNNGENPCAGLTLIGSTLYGTTISGGGYNDGTVFSVPVSGGSPTLLASFSGSNGNEPVAGLTLSADGSTLYGTTMYGGAYGDGTVFSIPVSGGSPTLLASFNGSDGSSPEAALMLSGNTLYGTTCVGGAYGGDYGDGDGTVFALAVPEPSTIALLLASAACLSGYAWRRRTMRNRALMVVALASVLAMTASISQAQVSNVFNMPSGEASLQFVTVGNPGNAADTTTGYGSYGYGSVPYVYQMGKYDVTIGQYCQFLNAVAATDTYGLYNSDLALMSGWETNSMPTVGIVQSGSPGSYTYSVSYTAGAWSSYVAYNSNLYPSALAAANDAPIFDMTWGDAARFCNWLQNGQPTNLGEAAGSTETGAYTLNGDTSSYLETRNPNATYFIPSENEWYKAAYFNPSNGTYWLYPTQSNTVPSYALSATGTNNANFLNGSNQTDSTNCLTPVGAFMASPGPYGTYDMGGDVWQWNEAIIQSETLGGCRGLRGGSWGDNYRQLRSIGDDYDNAASANIWGYGFRVATSVPEPSAITLLLACAACLLGYAWRRRRVRQLVSAAAVLLGVTAGTVQAQGVFNMPNGEASLQFVTVGDPGNAADSTGYGSVSYAYQMGKYDVTVGQYCQLLNAVAASDTYGLYNSGMAVGAYAGYPTVGITQSGSLGSYTYSVSYNASAWSSYVAYDPSLYPSAQAAADDAPVFDVTWGDAARFANWLQNGQPSFAPGNPGEVAGSTETGAYTLNGATSNSALMAVTRNAGATYFIPSENEWCKAAYFDPSNGTYWTYPTQSNTAPINILSVTGENNANLYDYFHTGNGGYTDATNWLTPGGAFAGSPGPFGTYDMGGDVYQWNEANVSNEYRGMRGGAWDVNSTVLPSGFRGDGPPSYENLGIGFRVAAGVPEPSTIALLLAGAACLVGSAWRRRKMGNRALIVIALASVLTMAAGISQAQGVFNMPSGEASLQFVTVGDPGNAADPNTGSFFGSVPYVYNIGKYDVTVGQYCQFLNAVAATDTYGLYDSFMATAYSTVGIIQSGSPGSYTYSVSYSASAWNSYATSFPSLYPSALAAAADCPVVDVSWDDAARFCNWLQNGQPTSLGEVANSTETGAYSVESYMPARNAGATYFIPSDNEWYKAAYYNPKTDTYWSYPTQSNTAPSNVLSATGTNNANYEPASTYTDPTNYLTPVGVFAASPGPYGTYDMGGDVYQWNDTVISNQFYRVRGGGWIYGSANLASSSNGTFYDPTSDYYRVVGFRVASVPEPSAIALLLASAACLLGFAWRRRTMRNRALMVVALASVLTMTASITQAQISNEDNVSNQYRHVRGGCYGRDDTDLYAGVAYYPASEYAYIGFRVAASVPEPSTIALLLAGAACLLGFAGRRRTASSDEANETETTSHPLRVARFVGWASSGWLGLLDLDRGPGDAKAKRKNAQASSSASAKDPPRATVTPINEANGGQDGQLRRESSRPTGFPMTAASRCWTA